MKQKITLKTLRVIAVCILMSFILFPEVAHTQEAKGVSIGKDGNAPNRYAILDVWSNDRGILIPRMGSIERLAISPDASADGLLVYDTDTKTFWYWDSTKWIQAGAGSGGADNQSLYLTGDSLMIQRGMGVPYDALADHIYVHISDSLLVDNDFITELTEILNLHETVTNLMLNADGYTLEYTNEEGTLQAIDLSAIIHNFETLTTIALNGEFLEYTDENGLVTSLDIGALVSLLETLTTLTLNADGHTLEYVDENGSLTSIDLAVVIDNFETLTILSYTNNDLIYTDENGHTTTIAMDFIIHALETTTHMTLNADGYTIEYLNEDGDLETVNVKAIIYNHGDTLLSNNTFITNLGDTILANQSFYDSLVSLIYNEGDTLLYNQIFMDSIYNFTTDSILNDILFLTELQDSIDTHLDSVTVINDSLLIYHVDGTAVDTTNLGAIITGSEPWYSTATSTGASNNTDSVYIMGNVGIGTSTPSSLLHLYRNDGSSDIESKLTIGKEFDLETLGLNPPSTATASYNGVSMLEIHDSIVRSDIDYAREAFATFSGTTITLNGYFRGTQGNTGIGVRSRVIAEGSGDYFTDNEGSLLKYNDLPHVQPAFANSYYMRNRVKGTYVNGISLQANGDIRFIQGANPFDANVKMILSNENLGIGNLTPTNRLHVVDAADPLRLEGLQEQATDSILVARGDGVVKYMGLTTLADSIDTHLDSITHANGQNLYYVNGAVVDSTRIHGTVQGTDGNTYNIRATDENTVQFGSVAGDARGQNSVDLQTVRHLSTHVASGLWSVIVGGGDNTASGGGSTVLGGIGNIASGSGSTASGSGNTASGSGSTAFGGGNTASGSSSFVTGLGNAASGNGSTAFGTNNFASGNYSTAFGQENTAPSYREITIGSSASNYTPSSATSWNAGDRLFTIGNGTGTSSRRNALTMLKSGNTGINTEMPTNRLHVVDAADPLRLEGVQVATDDTLLTIDATGIVHKVASADVVSNSLTAGNLIDITGGVISKINNLSIVSMAANVTIDAASYPEGIYRFDMSSQGSFTITAFTNMVDGGVYNFHFLNGASNTVTFPVSFVKEDGTALGTMTIATNEMVTFYHYGGVNYTMEQ